MADANMLWCIKQVAQFIGVETRTARQLVKNNRKLVRPVVFNARLVRYRPEAIQALVKAHSTK